MLRASALVVADLCPCVPSGTLGQWLAGIIIAVVLLICVCST